MQYLNTNLTLVIHWFFRLDENGHGTLRKVEDGFVEEGRTAQGSVRVAFDTQSVLARSRCTWDLLYYLYYYITSLKSLKKKKKKQSNIL